MASDRSAHAYLDWPGPIAFAHRGGTRAAPENTLAAFRHAIALGYRYLETDVHLTRDAVVVAFHDPDLQRTCGRPGLIDDLDWSEVATARVGGTEPIPRLDDLLEEFPTARINIDCKSDAVVDGVISALRRHQALDRVCLASFSGHRLRVLRDRLGPDLCTALSPIEVAGLRLLGRYRGPGHVAQVPVRQGPLTLVDERFVERAKRHRIPVHVWTIDDAVSMHQLLDLGVDGIMTDDPELLRDVLIERGQWQP